MARWRLPRWHSVHLKGGKLCARRPRHHTWHLEREKGEAGEERGPLTRWHLEHLKLFLWPCPEVSPGVLRAAASLSVALRLAARAMMAFTLMSCACAGVQTC
jgi:hypothetical protein